jgi:uncharacterized membrane protein
VVSRAITLHVGRQFVAEGMADNDVTSMMKALAIEPLDVRPRLPMHDAPQTGEPAR